MYVKRNNPVSRPDSMRPGRQPISSTATLLGNEAVEQPQPPGSTITAFAGGMLLVVWLVSLGLIIASLMTGHWVVLPHPSVGDVLQPGPEAPSRHTENGLTAFHFLYADCPCSQRILRHVIDRETVPGISERIVLVGSDPIIEQRAKSRGYECESISADILQSRYGVQAAPLLVVTGASGAIVYSGGYTARKQGYQIRDVETLTALVSGDRPSSLPVYGCAVSQELQSLIDPFRLKYKR